MEKGRERLWRGKGKKLYTAAVGFCLFSSFTDHLLPEDSLNSSTDLSPELQVKSLLDPTAQGPQEFSN